MLKHLFSTILRLASLQMEAPQGFASRRGESKFPLPCRLSGQNSPFGLKQLNLRSFRSPKNRYRKNLDSRFRATASVFQHSFLLKRPSVLEAFELIVAPEIGPLEIRINLQGFLEDRMVVPLQPLSRFYDFFEKIAWVHSDQFSFP